MFLLLQQDIGGWASGNSPNAGTPAELRGEFDYVRVWQQ